MHWTCHFRSLTSASAAFLEAMRGSLLQKISSKKESGVPNPGKASKNPCSCATVSPCAHNNDGRRAA